MVPWCKKIEAKPWFHLAVDIIIILNSIALGMETSSTIRGYDPQLFANLFWVFQIVFVAELTIRFFAADSATAFFLDGWNTFDFIIVSIAFIPATGRTATIGRLARVLRVIRLIEIFPDMKLIISTMLRSMRSMAYVILLINFLLYTYAIIGYRMFHEADPENWGDIGNAMWSLFQTMTIEQWVDQQKRVADVPGYWVFYASFLIIATYVVVNLFVAVVVNNLQEVKAEHREAQDAAHTQAELLAEIDDLRKQLARFDSTVRAMKT